jgi:hypothetical protein
MNVAVCQDGSLQASSDCRRRCATPAQDRFLSPIGRATPRLHRTRTPTPSFKRVNSLIYGRDGPQWFVRLAASDPRTLQSTRAGKTVNLRPRRHKTPDRWPALTRRAVGRGCATPVRRAPRIGEATRTGTFSCLSGSVPFCDPIASSIPCPNASATQAMMQGSSARSGW